MDQSPTESDDDRPNINLSSVEQQDAEARAGPSSTVVYASIASRGVEELRRPFSGLWWSGVSAGIVLTTSVVSEGLFHHVLPDVPGMHAVSDIGYTIGFIIVILGRMQLFTENTITPVLPLLTNPTPTAISRLLRMWLVVFAANILGAFIGAWMLSSAAIVAPDQLHAIVEVSTKVMANSPLETLRYGVIAGFLIAALVWLMPSSRGSEFWVIFLITYIIALGDFTHVVAGAAEAFLLWFDGRVTIGWVFGSFIAPALAGNVLGGTVIFAVLAFAQVREEIAEQRYPDRDPFAPMKRRKHERRAEKSPAAANETAAPPKDAVGSPPEVEEDVRGRTAAERAERSSAG